MSNRSLANFSGHFMGDGSSKKDDHVAASNLFSYICIGFVVDPGIEITLFQDTVIWRSESENAPTTATFCRP
jgi:hypothetical protein